MTERLIIFARNMIKGRVKTRIAARIGEDMAFKLYELLFNRTIEIMSSLPTYIQPVIYYSDRIEKGGMVKSSIRCEVQEGNNLGERMANSIRREIEYGAKKVCIIGTDIYDLNTEIIGDAFDKIRDNELVIGPATDGGYYLIGVYDFIPELFIDIEWGKSTVLEATIKRIENIGMQYQLLEYLHDVDEYEDIPEEIRLKLNLKKY